MPEDPNKPFDFDDIPMGHSKVLSTDEYGFTTVIRVPGGWIVRLHKLREQGMTSEVVTGMFVANPARPDLSSYMP